MLALNTARDTARRGRTRLGTATWLPPAEKSEEIDPRRCNRAKWPRPRCGAALRSSTTFIYNLLEKNHLFVSTKYQLHEVTYGFNLHVTHYG